MIAFVPSSSPIRALCLVSGGLDSLLAVNTLRSMGVETVPMVCTSPLVPFERLRRVATHIPLKLHRCDFTADLIGMLRAGEVQDPGGPPPFAAIQLAMLQCARERLKEECCQFVATGDVLNQHGPDEDSQDMMAHLDNLAGLGGLVVRPLSGQLLSMSAPERFGWVRRAGFHDFSGRHRRRQRSLARELGWPEDLFESPRQPLLDQHYLRRLRDLLARQALEGARDLILLRIGRHFLLGDGIKLILGRSQEENAELEGLRELGDLMLRPQDRSGPTGLLPITAGEKHIILAAQLCAFYSGAEPGETVSITLHSAQTTRVIAATACDADAPKSHRI